MVRSGLNKIFCYIYLHFIIILNDTKICVLGRLLGHTPREGGVRTKKFCITFDTIFGRYLPRHQEEQKLVGPGNVGWGLFAKLQKFQVKCRKKALKRAKMVSNFFLGPHTC